MDSKTWTAQPGGRAALWPAGLGVRRRRRLAQMGSGWGMEVGSRMCREPTRSMPGVFYVGPQYSPAQSFPVSLCTGCTAQTDQHMKEAHMRRDTAQPPQTWVSAPPTGGSRFLLSTGWAQFLVRKDPLPRWGQRESRGH